MAFLKRLNEAGVKNIEMEATALAAITKAAGVRSGNVCVTIVNRLEGDQVRAASRKHTKVLKTNVEMSYCFPGDIHERGIDSIRSSPPEAGGDIHQEGIRK